MIADLKNDSLQWQNERQQAAYNPRKGAGAGRPDRAAGGAAGSPDLESVAYPDSKTAEARRIYGPTHNQEMSGGPEAGGLYDQPDLSHQEYGHHPGQAQYPPGQASSAYAPPYYDPDYAQVPSNPPFPPPQSEYTPTVPFAPAPPSGGRHGPPRTIPPHANQPSGLGGYSEHPASDFPQQRHPSHRRRDHQQQQQAPQQQQQQHSYPPQYPYPGPSHDPYAQDPYGRGGDGY